MIENEQTVLEENIKKEKRPKIVWVIFIYSILGVLSLASVFLTIVGYLPMDESTKVFFEKLGFIDYLLMLVAPSVMFIASLMLFKLKVVAVKLFWLNGIVYVINQVYNLTIRGYISEFSIGTSGLVMHALGLALIAFFIYYSNKLKNSGVLKP